LELLFRKHDLISPSLEMMNTMLLKPHMNLDTEIP